MSDKVFILYDNAVDRGTVTASSEAGDLVAANLQDSRISKVARTTGLMGQYWQVSWSTGEPISTVVLWNHNLDISATIHVRLSDNADMSLPKFDQVFEAWPPSYGADDIGADLCGYGGYPFLTALNAYKFYRVIQLGQTISAKHLRVDPVDDDLADGYFQAGRLIAGIGWTPTHNFSYGWEMDWEDASEQQEMDGGALYVDRRDKRRVLTLPFNFATEQDALGTYNDLNRIVGSSREILVMPHPGAAVMANYRTTVWGIPPKGGLKPPRQVKKNLFTFSITTKELIA